MVEQTDEAIVALVQAGDKEAFGILITRYEDKMTRYLRRFLSSDADIQDLVQEVFIKAYINIKSLDTSRRFSPWIYRIAHNECVNVLKKKSREKVSFFDLDVVFPHLPSSKHTDDVVVQEEMRRALDERINELPLKYREVLVLYYFEDMDYQEIADVLRIPRSTVGVRITRGKKMLKTIIERHNPVI
jgi:RNA polymerase sigma-70 factor (ECF subfamily)